MDEPAPIRHFLPDGRSIPSAARSQSAPDNPGGCLFVTDLQDDFHVGLMVQADSDAPVRVLHLEGHRAIGAEAPPVIDYPRKRRPADPESLPFNHRKKRARSVLSDRTA